MEKDLPIMKYLWWFIGDSACPYWVDLILAIIWIGLIPVHYWRFGADFMFYFLWAFAGWRAYQAIAKVRKVN